VLTARPLAVKRRSPLACSITRLLACFLACLLAFSLACLLSCLLVRWACPERWLGQARRRRRIGRRRIRPGVTWRLDDLWSVKSAHCGGFNAKSRWAGRPTGKQPKENGSGRRRRRRSCLALVFCTSANPLHTCKELHRVQMAACRSSSTLVFCTSANPLHTCKELHRVQMAACRSSSTLVFCTSANPLHTCKELRPAVRVQRYSNLHTVTHFRCKTHALVQRLGNTIYAVCEIYAQCEGWKKN
jgi:hypothetical protein